MLRTLEERHTIGVQPADPVSARSARAISSEARAGSAAVTSRPRLASRHAGVPVLQPTSRTLRAPKSSAVSKTWYEIPSRPV